MTPKPPPSVTVALAAVQRHFRRPFTRDAVTENGDPYTSFEGFWSRLQPILAEYGFVVLQQSGEIAHVESLETVTITTLLFHESIDGGTKPWHVSKSQVPVVIQPNSNDDLAGISRAVAAGKRLALMTIFGLTQKPVRRAIARTSDHWTPDEQVAVETALEPLSPKQRATITRGKTSPHDIILAANLLTARLP